MFNGIYERLINKLVDSELKTVNREQFFVKESPIEKAEASKLLSQYLSEVINCALGMITVEKLHTALSCSDFDFCRCFGIISARQKNILKLL